MGRKRNTKEKVGDCFLNSKGEKYKIIRIESYADVDVEFEDGTLATHLLLTTVRNGEINKNHDKKRLKSTAFKSRVGEISYNNRGEEMEILEYWNASNMTVLLKQSMEVLHHVQYRNFKKGSVLGTVEKEDLTGKTNVNLNGQMMTIVAFDEKHNVTVKFEDGNLVLSKYKDFKMGRVINPQFSYIGKTTISNMGIIATITNFIDYDHVEISDMYGNKKMITYHDFINHKFSFNGYFEDKYIGLTKVANNGQLMKIIDYNNSNDVTIQFEDGTITTDRVGNFKKGSVANPFHKKEERDLYGKTKSEFLIKLGRFVKKMKAEGSITTKQEIDKEFTLYKKIVYQVLKQEKILVLDLDEPEVFRKIV